MRVLTVDDHVLFRRCLVNFLTAYDDITIVGEAESYEPAMQMISDLHPDISLIDIDLDGQDGLELTKDILQRDTRCAVIMLTASQNEANMLKAVQIGASGYIVKDMEPDSLVTAMRSVMLGDTVFPRSFLMNQVKNPTRKNNYDPGSSEIQDHGKVPNKILTNRELEVLQLVTDALTDKRIAIKLSVSMFTIKNHMKSIRRKLKASNRVEASMKGIQMGIVENRSNDESGKNCLKDFLSD
ncbi:MAG: response regulator transcription factor [Gammaproteobacteria bacterium]|nr:MAG: response regulator transcription factor [Gammaproteobacteria bacterium]